MLNSNDWIILGHHCHRLCFEKSHIFCIHKSIMATVGLSVIDYCFAKKVSSSSGYFDVNENIVFSGVNGDWNRCFLSFVEVYLRCFFLSINHHILSWSKVKFKYLWHRIMLLKKIMPVSNTPTTWIMSLLNHRSLMIIIGIILCHHMRFHKVTDVQKRLISTTTKYHPIEEVWPSRLITCTLMT